MEWNNGAGQPQPVNKPAHTGSRSRRPASKMVIAGVALLACAAVLILGVTFLVAKAKPADSQGKFVDKTKMQAVFLNGGQVYFGKIKTLNDKFMRVGDIYYLRVNQTVQPNQTNATNQQATSNDISLVKLGCELHGPQDDMVINQDQIIFWENLKDDGQVAKAVKQYKEQNPNGQKCDTSTSTNTNSSSTGTGTTNNTSNTTTNKTNTTTGR